MIIGMALAFFGLIGFLIPREHLKKYYLLVAFILSTSLVFYNPPETDDLYRYYNMFDIIKDLSFKDLLNGQFGVTDWYYNYMLSDYMQSSRTFMVILFVIAKLGIKQLLPMLFCMLSYVPIVILIDKLGKREELSRLALNFAYITMLFCFDFRFATLLRNPSSYALFALLLYIDLVENRNKWFCFIGYILLCGLHMASVVLVFIRILIGVFRSRFRKTICIVLLFMNTLLQLIIMVLSTFGGGFTYITRLIKRINDYYYGRTAYNINGAMFFVGSIIVTLIVFAFVATHVEQSEEDEKFSLCYLYLTFFTIGSIKQYDILVRNTKLIVLLCIPSILYFFNNFVRSYRNHLYIMPTKNGKVVTSFVTFVSIMCLIITSILFYTLFSYMPMQAGF